jgi:hypothetical protein
MSEDPSFRPAKPRAWVIRVVQIFLRFHLARWNRLHLEPRDLDRLRALPSAAGVILVANHADEADIQVCLELSRRSGRRFLFMRRRSSSGSGRCSGPNDRGNSLGETSSFASANPSTLASRCRTI